MRKFFPIILLIFVVSIFFSPVIFQNKLPIPADTIIGLYHPFRDFYAKNYPNGIPYKNFLITDPVRQQYPWRNLVINLEKQGQLPLWNPYNFAGSPLLANFQSAAFYPLNFLLFLFPVSFGWSFLILLQPILAGAFLYLYLNNLKLTRPASFLGAFTFAFCGFSVAWLEWGTVIHTGLWLPLLFLSIDKIFDSLIDSGISNFKLQISNIQIKIKKYPIWSLLFLFSLTNSFFAGHLQTFFYLIIVSFAYFLFRWIQDSGQKKTLVIFLIIISSFLILTLFQWSPTLQLILHSARGVDQNWHKEGWFIPWQNLIQFIAPDFFGNPATLNYWGTWNYAEFIGYIGIFPLAMAFFALFQKRDKLTFFFGSVFFLSLIFSLPTVFAMMPFQLQIPFLSTAQPTRILFLTDFSLAVLAAIGTDALIRHYKRAQTVYPLLFLGIIFIGLWIFVFQGKNILLSISAENLNIAKRNLYFPTTIFSLVATLLFAYGYIKNKTLKKLIVVMLLMVTVVDLLRFSNKFTPFASKDYLFPGTKTIEFLQKQKGQFRIMATDDRILPPNFSTMYQLQSIDGYDPLYLLSYGELIAASERGRPDISPPFGFNRIITPHNYQSKIIDLMGIRYILSLSELSSPKLKKVFQEGETRIYENSMALPRSFFVERVFLEKNKEGVIKKMMEPNFDIANSAVVEGNMHIDETNQGKAEVAYYSANKILVKIENDRKGFLVLTDTYYPTWEARIADLDMSVEIIKTDYNFRGVYTPAGNHIVEFTNKLYRNSL